MYFQWLLVKTVLCKMYQVLSFSGLRKLCHFHYFLSQLSLPYTIGIKIISGRWRSMVHVGLVPRFTLTRSVGGMCLMRSIWTTEYFGDIKRCLYTSMSTVCVCVCVCVISFWALLQSRINVHFELLLLGQIAQNYDNVIC